MAGRMETLQNNRTAEIKVLAEKERNITGMMETLDIIWKDRLDRFKDKLEEVNDYIFALPEALGVVNGVQNHYHYMADEMKAFLAFDVFSATVHNVGLLLRHADVVGISTVSNTILHLLPQDDFVDAVCSSIESTHSVEAPTSIADASQTFGFCMDQLHEARNRIIDRYGGVAMLPTTSSNTPKKSLLLDGLHAVVRQLRVSTMTADQREAVKRREAIEALFKDERQILQNKEDIVAAMDYVASLRGLLSTHPVSASSPASEANSQTNSGTVPSSQDSPSTLDNNPIGTKNGIIDPLTEAIRNDHGVQLALQQAELWRNAAGTFLLQQQAKDALKSYHLLMSECLTRHGKLPKEEEKAQFS